jgi:hypothetical protein
MHRIYEYIYLHIYVYDYICPYAPVCICTLLFGRYGALCAAVCIYVHSLPICASRAGNMNLYALLALICLHVYL